MLAQTRPCSGELTIPPRELADAALRRLQRARGNGSVSYYDAHQEYGDVIVIVASGDRSSMDSIAEICATLDVPSFAIAAAKHLCWEGNTDLPCAKNTQDSVRRIEELLKVVVRSVEQQAIVVRNLWAAALPNADKPPDLQVGVIGNMSVDDQSVLVLHLANELKRTLQFVTNGESIIVTPGDTLERITTACLATPDDPILPCAMAALAAKLKAAVLRLRQARPRGISVDRKNHKGRPFATLEFACPENLYQRSMPRLNSASTAAATL